MFDIILSSFAYVNEGSLNKGHSHALEGCLGITLGRGKRPAGLVWSRSQFKSVGSNSLLLSPVNSSSAVMKL